MKTAISIPDGIFEVAEELARRLEMSRSELYTRAVEAYVCSHRDEGVTDALNQVYATEDESVDPITERLQYSSIPKDEW
jgi:metal-responsive CopG/Arc/MetJ family transcriptional regulator